MSRSLLAAVLGAAVLALLLGGWLATGWQSARAEATAIRRAPAERARRLAAELAGELAGRLAELRARENARPYYHYQNLYHDPRGASLGWSVVPSPLAAKTADPLIEVHYQIDSDRVLTIPQVNEELPELSEQQQLTQNGIILEALRTGSHALGADEVNKADTGRAPVSTRGEIEQKVVVSRDAYAQNLQANSVFRDLKSPRGEGRFERAPDRESDPVEIATSSFDWSTVAVADRPRLVARRAVETPDGTAVQGFLIDDDAIAGWLAARGDHGLVARWVAEPENESFASPIAVDGGRWHIAVDAGGAIGQASARATAAERRFWSWFVPAGGLAFGCVLMVVWIVVRAERLASQRSQFAAAAAHELRTPLAGLQLYGEMLSDGLGDPDRADTYAHRIAEESARLGRVVANVLGFTQLERGALDLAPRPGDAADAARSAIERSRSALEHAGVHVRVEIPDSMPAIFDADSVARILQNLVDNAEKYSRDAEPRWIEISSRREGDDAVIEVADSGEGIDGRLKSRLFEPFTRGTDSDGPAGLGLGLALARALARAQSGELEYRGEPGSGARFALRLPAPSDRRA